MVIADPADRVNALADESERNILMRCSNIKLD